MEIFKLKIIILIETLSNGGPLNHDTIKLQVVAIIQAKDCSAANEL